MTSRRSNTVASAELSLQSLVPELNTRIIRVTPSPKKLKTIREKIDALERFDQYCRVHGLMPEDLFWHHQTYTPEPSLDLCICICIDVDRKIWHMLIVQAGRLGLKTTCKGIGDIYLRPLDYHSWLKEEMQHLHSKQEQRSGQEQDDHMLVIQTMYERVAGHTRDLLCDSPFFDQVG